MFRVPVVGAPKHHGWALCYKDGVPDLKGREGTTYITYWSEDEEFVTFDFGDNNARLWPTKEDARKVSQFLSTNCEIETEPVIL